MARFVKASGFLTASLATAAFVLATGAAQAAGNAQEGKLVFQDNCAICHTDTKGAGNKVGPNLFGVVGRKSATHAGYTYSAAMKKANLTWTAAELHKYLQGPQKVVPGTKMGFPGFTDQADEDNLIAYLATLK